MIIRGWIFDAYPLASGMSLWVLDDRGRMHALRDAWEPRFFVSAGPSFPASIRRYRLVMLGDGLDAVGAKRVVALSEVLVLGL